MNEPEGNKYNKKRSLFGKDGPLYFPYEAVETFLFRLPVQTTGGAHIRDAFDLKRMIMTVVIALVPCIIFGMYNIGYQHFLSQEVKAGISDCLITGAGVMGPLYLVTFAVGGGWEVLFAVVRKHEISEGFFVTGTLIPLIVPPTIPLWQLALGTTFGIVLGKEVFGGTGMNIFNPALVTRAFIFFSYPRSTTGSDVWTLLGDKTVDTFTMATPLAISTKANIGITEFLASNGYSFQKMLYGLTPGSIGETSFIAVMLGAFLLLISGVGSWRIMLSVFAGAILTSSIFNHFAPSPSSMMALPPHYHMVMGSFAFGAVFMATDPVSAAGTGTGKFIYGFLIGILAVAVRTYNPAFPEGMMLSILLMNLFAPLIDYIVIDANMRRRKKRAKR